jgi:hypothetical protein
MSRLLFAGLLLAGLAFGFSDRALALDYDEPVLPSQFLIAPAGPVAPPVEGGLTLLRREANVSRPAAAEPSAPAPARAPAYGGHGCADIGGRAVWNYNQC